MRAGLEVLLDDPGSLRGRRVGLVCNHTAVTRGLTHALPALHAAGVSVARVFGPEHGVDATAQDMIAASHLRWIRSNFHRIGMTDPTPEQLAWVWNVGWTNARSRNFRANDYALRVANLFRLSPTLR